MPILRVTVLIAFVALAVILVCRRVAISARTGEDPQVLRLGGMDLNLASVKAGSFVMGSKKDEPGHDHTEAAHQVTLTKPYWIGTVPVTRGQFARFVESSSYQTTAERTGRAIAHGDRGLVIRKGANWRTPLAIGDSDALPVVYVSDEDAAAFCKWASQRSGRNVRLPTEAEWEYTCRAGTTTSYAGPLNEMGWYAGNSGDRPLDCNALVNRGGAAFLKAVAANQCRPHPVGLKKPNSWGLYDMHGNVWEWCSDAYADYTPGPAIDPTGSKVEKPEWRCARGGDFGNIPSVARSANRGNWRPAQGYDMIGFRVVVQG